VLDRPVAAEYLAAVRDWMNGAEPYTTYAQFENSPTGTDLDRIVKSITSKTRGLLVVGRLKQRDGETAAVIDLASRLGWPVVTDILSGLRLRAIDSASHLSHFDLSLPDQSSALNFDCILHLGGPLVSKRIHQLVASQTAEYIVVNDHPDRQDSGHRVTMRIESDVATFARSVTARLPKDRPLPPENPLVATNRAISEVLAEALDTANDLCEPLVPRIIARDILADHSLVIASSLPIRDFDMYAPTDNAPAYVACNRGASGIDGTLATAVGVAHGRKRPTTLVIGDLAMLHDLNSLALLRTPDLPPITIVVINNGGGAIFSLLPVADLEATSVERGAGSGTFEKLFLQGHDLRFEAAARMFDVEYHNPASVDDFRNIYRKAVRNDRSTIIELTFDWRESRRIRRQLQDRIVARLKQV
jgi:2-succinyl-5-enolpyruvyl-6-hydroxy-3-cyclohexene-1-carboxylate synthase